MNSSVYVVMVFRVVPNDVEYHLMVTSFFITLSIFFSNFPVFRARCETEEADLLTDSVLVDFDHLESLAVSSEESAFTLSLVADVVS